MQSWAMSTMVAQKEEKNELGRRHLLIMRVTVALPLFVHMREFSTANSRWVSSCLYTRIATQKIFNFPDWLNVRALPKEEKCVCPKSPLFNACRRCCLSPLWNKCYDSNMLYMKFNTIYSLNFQCMVNLGIWIGMQFVSSFYAFTCNLWVSSIHACLLFQSLMTVILFRVPESTKG